MTPVSPSAIVSLRFRTGVSILACKEALVEADGDEEKAIEILRKRGIAQAAKKAGRDQSEGAIFIAEADGRAGVVYLQCETDFVARDENFQKVGAELAQTLSERSGNAFRAIADEKIPALVQKLGENISVGESNEIEAPVLGTYVHSNGKIGVVVGLDKGSTELAHDVAMHAAAMNPHYVNPEDVPANAVEREKEVWRAQLKSEGKPAAIMEKIMIGKERKYREENALVKQAFVKEPGKTVEQYLGGARVVAYCRIAVNE